MTSQPNEFTAVEWLAIRVLVGKLEAADDGGNPARSGLRAIGFHIEEFKGRGGDRFTMAELDEVLESGRVRIRG